MTTLEILTTPGCSHCGKAKELIKKIKLDFPNLKVKEIDIIQHPEVVQKYQIFSSPGIVINGKLEFVGVPNEEELRKKLNKI